MTGDNPLTRRGRTEVGNSLSALIKRAATTLPAQTGAAQRHRDNPHLLRTVVLADVSESMSQAAGARRRIDVLQEALDAVLPRLTDVALVAFAAIPTDVARGRALPDPSGSTALDRALDRAGELKPRRVLVLSDGQPDNEDTALAAAQRLGAPIDVLYCGPDGDRRALDFMRRLAAIGRGQVVVHDISRHAGSTRALVEDMRRLALPAPSRP